MSRLLVFLFISLVTLFSHAQEKQTAPPVKKGEQIFVSDPIEPTPDSFIVDDARLFKEREATQLSAQLKEFATQNQIPIYVVAYTALIGETLEERAGRLKANWLGGGPGVVIAYERATENLSFAADANEQTFLSRFDLQTLFESSYREAAGQDRGSSRVIAATELVLRDLPPALEYQRLTAGQSDTETRQFVGWSLAALALVATAGMLAFSFLRRTQDQETKSYEFPTIKVVERYGAAYSGGHQAEIQF